jgi:Secreted repeat of unknown function
MLGHTPPPFPHALVAAADSAARPGSCRKARGALYTENGKESVLCGAAYAGAVGALAITSTDLGDAPWIACNSLVTSGTPVAGPGVNASLLTTTKRTDGTLEVVYNGHPLYYFTGDMQAGDVTGQDLNSFGALWFVLAPNGSKIG